MKNKKLEILDCTIRDGGYYTDWDFDDELITQYFNRMNQLPVDIIEIGYRSIPEDEYKGKYYYLPDFVIKNLPPLMENTHFLLAFHIVSFKDNSYIAVRFCEPVLFPFDSSIESLFMEYRVVPNGKGTDLFCKISAFIKKGYFSKSFFSVFLFLNKIMMKRQFINVKTLAEKLSRGEIVRKNHPFSENDLRKGLIWFLFCRRGKCLFSDKYDFQRA